MNITFYIKSERDYTLDKKVKLYIRLRLGAKTEQRAATKHFVNPKHWDKKKQTLRNMAEVKSKDVRTLKEFKYDITTLIEDSLKEHPNITKGWLKMVIDNYYSQDTKAGKGFEAYCREFIRRQNEPKDNGKVRSYRYRRNIEHTVERILTYFEYIGQYPDFKKFDRNLILGFEKWLQQKEGLCLHTTRNFLKRLKMILREAKADGEPAHDFIFSSYFRTSYSGKTENIYLKEEELKELYNYDFSNTPRLEKARDYFIFGCYTGLRFSDIATITKDMINDNEQIIIDQGKTEATVTIPLLSYSKEILLKYDYQLPTISNQKFNKYIKELCKKAGFDEPIKLNGEELPKYSKIASHTMRRSFASNMFRRGISPSFIMKVTGHKTERQFYEYIKVSSKEYADLFAEQFQATEKKMLGLI